MSNVTDRQKQFKKCIDTDESRRQREDTTIQIRKNKKEERLNQRRRLAPAPQAGGKATFGVGQFDSSLQQKLGNLPEMIKGAQSPDQSVQLDAVTKFRKLLSIERNPPIQQVIDSNMVPILVEFLKREDSPALQFEAAWALTNIASGTSDHTHVLVQNGAIPLFCSLLLSKNDDVREQAVWALGNIAGDSPQLRDLVLQAGAIVPLLQQLGENVKLTMLRNATWTLSNFCRGKPQPHFDMVRSALPTLSNLIYSKDEEVLTDACWTLSYLSDGPNEKIQAVIESGACPKLIELLLHPSGSVQTPALRTVGNIVTGDDLQTQIVINYSILPCLLSLLSNPKKGIRKESCWTISNITAGNTEQIQKVIEANLIPPLVQLLTTAELDIRKEAAWAISNATSGGSPEQIKYLVHQEVADAKIIAVALEGLENILKVGDLEARENDGVNQMAEFIDEADGINKIQKLQFHENEEIYLKSVQIVENYFGVEEEEDQEITPITAPNSQQFHFGTSEKSVATNGNSFNFSGTH